MVQREKDFNGNTSLGASDQIEFLRGNADVLCALFTLKLDALCIPLLASVHAFAGVLLYGVGGD
jgi:hypothetical protein